jgi:hypothetical protein
MIPRMSLIIFIEIFSYFFLRLYKDGLGEIRFFQNELTNIESKLIALKSAQMSNNSKAIQKATEYLSRTERNFLISKKQTTLDLEKARSYAGFGRDIAKILPNLFKDK